MKFYPDEQFEELTREEIDAFAESIIEKTKEARENINSKVRRVIEDLSCPKCPNPFLDILNNPENVSHLKIQEAFKSPYQYKVSRNLERSELAAYVDNSRNKLDITPADIKEQIELINKEYGRVGKTNINYNLFVVEIDKEIEIDWDGEEYNFGKFFVGLNLTNSIVYAFPLNPIFAREVEDGYVHPNIGLNGSICLGDGTYPIWQAVEQGRLLDAIDLIYTILSTYGVDSPYERIEAWKGFSCPDCGTIYPWGNEDIIYCDYCDREYCSDCQIRCENCSNTWCPECYEENHTCEGCNILLCNDCVATCDDCGNIFCDGCLTCDEDDKLRCQSCHDEWIAENKVICEECSNETNTEEISICELCDKTCCSSCMEYVNLKNICLTCAKEIEEKKESEENENE